MPEWARDEDSDDLAELRREDAEQRALDAGERPAAASLPLGEWSTTEQVAAHLRRSPKTIRRYIAEGRLKATGSKHVPYRIRRADVEALMASKTAPEATKGRKRGGPARAPKGSRLSV